MAIALNPLNSNIQLGAWNDRGVDQPGYAFSTDGGANWVAGLLPPHGGNPSVGFDKHNVAYYCYIDRDDSRIHVSRNSDRGPVWPDQFASANGVLADKPEMVIDNSGSSYDGRIYVAWKANSREVHFSYSTDGGASFSTENTLYQESQSLGPLINPRYQGPIPVVGPNGVLYVIYLNYLSDPTDYIQVRKSTNGGVAFGPPQTVTQFTNFEQWIGEYDILDYPLAAADMNTGRLYVAYHSGDGVSTVKINLTYSDDGGVTWVPSFTIGDLGSNTWQFHPWISVDPTGKVSISFMSDTTGTNRVNAFLVESFDNGNTFAPAIKLSSTSSNALLACLNEYQGLASTTGLMYPLWTDTRDGNANPYTDRVVGIPTASTAVATAYGSSPKSAYTSADGRWNAVFQSNASLYSIYSTNSGSSWDGYVRISAASSSLDQYSNPGLIASSNGNLHVIWDDGGGSVINYNRRVSGSWLTAPISLWSNPTVMSPSFALGSDDSAHIVWVQSSIALSVANCWLKHGTFKITDAGPLLRNVGNITSSTGSISTPSVAMDASNTTHVVWQQGSNIYYSCRTGNTWSSPQLLSDQTKPSSSPGIVAIGSTIYVTWQASYSGNLEICYRNRSGGTWGSIQNISNTSGSSVEPSITRLPSLGEPCIVWSDNTGGNYDIRYYLPVSGVGGSFKTTSLDSHNPTVTSYHIGLADRVFALWTDGSSSPFILDHDYRNLQPMLAKSSGKDNEKLMPRLVSEDPTDYLVAEPYPNPFNPSTTLRFGLPSAGNVSLIVYDVLGREVTTLVRGTLDAGYHTATWNALSVASGVYFARLTVTNDFGKVAFNRVTKLLLMK
jgi:hypothetical protein